MGRKARQREFEQRREILELLRQIAVNTEKIAAAVGTRGDGGFKVAFLRTTDKY